MTRPRGTPRVLLRIRSALFAAAVLVACAGTPRGGHGQAEVAAQAVQALRARDWPALARLAHPKEGIRFSPYAYVDTASGIVLSVAELAVLGRDATVRRWGNYDGSGEPIELSFASYFERFVYDRDFAGVTPGRPNERVGRGNSIDNIRAAYAPRPVSFMEFHLPGSERYNGMDWRSLRIVLEHVGNRWYVTAIVHDQWTI